MHMRHQQEEAPKEHHFLPRGFPEPRVLFDGVPAFDEAAGVDGRWALPAAEGGASESCCRSSDALGAEPEEPPRRPARCARRTGPRRRVHGRRGVQPVKARVEESSSAATMSTRLRSMRVCVGWIHSPGPSGLSKKGGASYVAARPQLRRPQNSQELVDLACGPLACELVARQQWIPTR